MDNLVKVKIKTKNSKVLKIFEGEKTINEDDEIECEVTEGELKKLKEDKDLIINISKRKIID